MNKLTLVLTTLTLFIISGCAGIPSSMIASTSPIPPGVRGTIPAKGSNCQYRLLGILPLSTSPNTADALREAKRDADVDVLTDVTVDFSGAYYILFSNRCVRVEGQGVPRELLEQSLAQDSQNDF